MATNKIEELLKYGACEVADALLKLEVPGAGFLPDIEPLNEPQKSAAPATTVLFIHKPSTSFSGSDIDHVQNGSTTNIPSNMPLGSIYSDLIVPGTIAVLSQPKGARTATMGGIMAMRIAKLGAKGVIVDGRVRDVKSLKRDVDMPIWSKSTSIVATSGECKAHSINVPISVGPTKVEPNDIVMLDPAENGAVCIPKDKLDQVLEMLPGLAAADERKMKHILNGMTVEEAARVSK